MGLIVNREGLDGELWGADGSRGARGGWLGGVDALGEGEAADGL